MFNEKENQQLCCYTQYLTFSVSAFVILTVIHSWLTYDQVNLVNFIVPVFAGLIVGLLMARNKVLQVQLLELANTDKLTGAYNRQYLDKRLEEELDRAGRYNHQLSIIYLDLDFFKNVNDQYGHKIGDSVLVDFAKISQGAIRESDIFARFGGEEFIILVQMANRNAAYALYERIKIAIDRHNFEAVKAITFSAGISEFEGKDDSITKLLERADKALYKAKENGRNQAVLAE